jgi:predicted amidophosphoribosyltransferase
MTRWQRLKRTIRIAWQGECSKDGCERGLIPRPFSSSKLCEEHYFEWMEKIGREMADRDFEREVSIHAEALRRVKVEDAAQTLERLAREERAEADGGGLPNDIATHRGAQGAYETAVEVLRNVGSTP